MKEMVMHIDRETRAKVIIEAVANSYGFTAEKVLSNERTRPVSEARHVAMFIVREQCQFSLSETARIFGRKDHATVVNAVENVRFWIQHDRDFKARWPQTAKAIFQAISTQQT